TRDQRRGERGGRRARAADPLSDLREHEREHEDEEEGLQHGARDELPEVLALHGEVAQQQGLERGQRGGARGTELARGARRGGGGHCGRGHQSRRSFPVSWMKTVSSVGSDTETSLIVKPPRSAVAITSRSAEREPRSLRRTDPSTTRAPVTPPTDCSSNRARPSRSPSAVIVINVSASIERLSAAGVSSASRWPWSTIASRSHSWSASSM